MCGGAAAGHGSWWGLSPAARRQGPAPAPAAAAAARGRGLQPARACTRHPAPTALPHPLPPLMPATLAARDLAAAALLAAAGRTAGTPAGRASHGVLLRVAAGCGTDGGCSLCPGCCSLLLLWLLLQQWRCGLLPGRRPAAATVATAALQLRVQCCHQAATPAVPGLERGGLLLRLLRAFRHIAFERALHGLEGVRAAAQHAGDRQGAASGCSEC